MTTTPNIIPVDIETEIEQAYLDYAMSVIIGRALPGSLSTDAFFMRSTSSGTATTALIRSQRVSSVT